MKKCLFFSIIGLPIMLLLSFQYANKFGARIEKFHPDFAAGGSSLGARTGAPGESNCTSCHSGSPQSGLVENTLAILSDGIPVTSYIPGKVYTVTLEMSSNPTKKGFEAVALDETNVNAGSFSADVLGGTQKFTIVGREYVSHRSTSNSSATGQWSWTWTAPNDNVGAVTFYVSTNKANGNGTATGDVIYLSQHSFNSELTIDELNLKGEPISFSYIKEKHALSMFFGISHPENIKIHMYDLSGKSVLNTSINCKKNDNQVIIDLPNALRNGMYAINLEIKNKIYYGKIVVWE